jgi:hypothetical protein
MAELKKVKPEKQSSMAEMSKPVKIYPTFNLDSEDLPELADWKVGQKYMLEMQVEQMSMRQGKEWQGSSNDDKKVHATFKIMKVGVKKEDYQTEYARKRSGARA